MSDSLHNPRAAPADPRPSRLPLGLAAAALIATSVALMAAAGNLRWGSAVSSRGDALEFAWAYVNVTVGLLTLTLWPALAMARRWHRRNGSRRGANDVAPACTDQLRWDLAALAVGALPALVIAAALSPVPPAALGLTVFLQAALAIFTLGLLTATCDRHPWDALAAGVLALATAGLPLVAYLWAEFFPAAPQAWPVATPLIALARASQNATFAIVWIGILYAGAGGILLLVENRREGFRA